MAPKSRLVSLMPIKKMNRALKFYTKALGARMGERAPGAMKDSWASVKLGGADVWLIAPSKWERRTLAYTTLMVKNIKSAVKELTRRGVKFEKAERMGPESKVVGPITFEPFGASAFFQDSEGNLLMLWQNVPPM